MGDHGPRRRLSDSVLVAMSGMAGFTCCFAVWSAVLPVSYSAEEVRLGAIVYLMGSAGFFMLMHSVSEAVRMQREIRAEERDRPERERKLEAARQAAEAEAAARGENWDV